MTAEIQEMIQDLKKEGATYYQVRVVIGTIDELSVEEKHEILREFLPPDNATLPPLAAAVVAGSTPASFSDRLQEWAKRWLNKINNSQSTLILNLVKWGLAIFFGFYALWAMARFLEKLIMKI